MRRSTPRMKSGCRTCRIRRVKCDEAKPYCLRCTQTGRKCDGFAVQQNTAPAAPLALVHKSTYNSSPALFTVTSYSIPFRMPGSQRDRQLLHYYCVQGARELSGFIQCDFWSRTALLAGQDESIVRQSLITLSSLHLDLSRPDGSVKVKDEALMRYGKALRSLQSRINRPDETVQARRQTSKTALICCVLFYCFESSMGETRSAMSHLNNGLELLATHQQSQTDNDEQIASLRDMFSRLDLQASFFDDERSPRIKLASPDERQLGLATSPHDTFFGIEDAQSQLIKLENWLFHFLQDTSEYKSQPRDSIPSEVLGEKQHLEEAFRQWAYRYNTYTQTSSSSTPSPLSSSSSSSSSSAGSIGLVQSDPSIATCALYVHHDVFTMMLASRTPDQPSIFGKIPNPRAHKILQLCESILVPGHHPDPVARAKGNPEPPRRILSTETGIIAALYLLAVKCADESIGEKVVELLTIYQGREGLYDAVAVCALLRRLQAVKSQRQQRLNEEGHGCQEKSLEYWTGDLIDRAVGGFDGLAVLTS